jgi:hypothetical protein
MQETYSSKANTPENNLAIRLRKLPSILKVALIKPVKMLVVEIPVLSLTLYTAYAYALVFSYFASNAYVLPLYYGFDAKETGLSFLSIVIGYFLAATMFFVLDGKLYKKAAALSDDGMAAPEHRLYAAMVGSICLPASLFW